MDRLYAPGYIQHNPNFPQGRDALQALVADLTPAVYYEPGLIVAAAISAATLQNAQIAADLRRIRARA